MKSCPKMHLQRGQKYAFLDTNSENSGSAAPAIGRRTRDGGPHGQHQLRLGLSHLTGAALQGACAFLWLAVFRETPLLMQNDTITLLRLTQYDLAMRRRSLRSHTLFRRPRVLPSCFSLRCKHVCRHCRAHAGLGSQLDACVVGSLQGCVAGGSAPGSKHPAGPTGNYTRHHTEARHRLLFLQQWICSATRRLPKCCRRCSQRARTHGEPQGDGGGSRTRIIVSAITLLMADDTHPG